MSDLAMVRRIRGPFPSLNEDPLFSVDARTHRSGRALRCRRRVGRATGTGRRSPFIRIASKQILAGRPESGYSTAPQSRGHGSCFAACKSSMRPGRRAAQPWRSRCQPGSTHPGSHPSPRRDQWRHRRGPASCDRPKSHGASHERVESFLVGRRLPCRAVRSETYLARTRP